MTPLRAGLSDRQRNAADPAASVWVSANAGTGKTRVLTDRVLRLLLSGAHPERILCLTFTKAAAAEMASRLSERLAGWVAASPSALQTALFDLMGQHPDEALQQRARRLFADVLDTPGGMKVQTIHSFCQTVLSRFPLEANLQPYFKIVDEPSGAALLDQVQHLILESRTGERDADLAILSGEIWESGLHSLIHRIAQHRNRLNAVRQHYHGFSGVVAALAAHFGIHPEECEDQVLTQGISDHACDAEALKRAATALLTGRKTDIERGQLIADWLKQPDKRAQNLDAYRNAFFTKDASLRKTLATKSVISAMADIVDILSTEAARLTELEARLASIRLLRLNKAFLRIAFAMTGAYESEKQRSGLLDYEDLIFITDALLAAPDRAQWVLYKLDGGIDHVLLDESQDTSPAQWSVISQLTGDFFTGQGRYDVEAKGLARTVFAVGDPKQSIYSFQGADPKRYQSMHHHFQDRVHNAGEIWRAVPLIESFRSTSPVLELVDRLFQDDQSRQALGLRDGDPLEHQAHRAGHEGLVELWPLYEPEDRDDGAATPWPLPVHPDAAVPPERQLAVAITQQIVRWIADQEHLPARGRAVVYGDILILVQRRSAFVNDLVREFKAAGIPVSGVDRMELLDQLAVMDLLALSRFIQQPDDDLSLAELLKSPLVNIDDEALFSLCHGRHGSLWQTLIKRAEEMPEKGPKAPPWREIARQLQTWMNRVGQVTPFAFYTDVLSRGGGRRKLLQRLGYDANDAIDEFINLALHYEGTETPSLQGFLQWLQQGGTVVKRDIEDRGDEVRIMTVHGSKGLQAPIVILPDTVRMPGQVHDTGGSLLWLEQSDALPLPLWLPRVSRANPAANQARQAVQNAEKEEHLRLLYVALTRAADRLYVAGWTGQRKVHPQCWYRRIEKALHDLGAAPDNSAAGAVLRYYKQQGAPVPVQDQPITQQPPSPAPDWLRSDPPFEDNHLVPLVPSRAESDTKRLSPFADNEGRRFRRGALIHTLLEYLPNVSPAERLARAQRYLRQPIFALPPAVEAEICTAALSVLDNVAFRDLFAENSRAEVAVTGRIAGRTVSGRIDRLCVSDKCVKIIDYKSGQAIPPTPEQTPAVYCRQMAVYAELLRQIYPNHQVEAYLLWTDGPKIVQLPAALLHRALADLVPEQ